jgi:hypothetical protein
MNLYRYHTMMLRIDKTKLIYLFIWLLSFSAYAGKNCNHLKQTFNQMLEASRQVDRSISSTPIFENYIVRDLINSDKILRKEARKSMKSVGDKLRAMEKNLSNGIFDMGMGTKHLFKHVYEARNGSARIYFRKLLNGQVEILAKSNKNNQHRVITRLRNLYNN